MKLVKIGRAQGCNIQINNPVVSGLHAELLILDDGKIFIEDKSSTNGTYVAGQRIEPGVETEIRRGDLVQFGSVPLNWAQVPVPDKNTNVKHVYNIGSNYRNDMVVSDPYVSRYHAVLRIKKDKKAYLCDVGSRNGTSVNGMKIAPNKEVQVRRGDVITLGNKDITEEISPLLPKKNNWLLWAAIGIGAAAVIVGAIFGIKAILNGGGRPVDPTEVRKAVVYVTASYQLCAKIDECPINDDIWVAVMREAFPNDANPRPGEIPYGDPRAYSATAFFLDRDGNMGTNRHVASPWEQEYLSSEDKDKLRADVDRFVAEQQLPFSINSSEALEAYNTAGSMRPNVFILWRMIYNQALKEYESGREKNPINYINSLIRQMKKCKVTITGKMVEICVGYAGRNYTHTDEFERCKVVAVSPTDDIDLAILQLNTKKTPEDVTFVFDPSTYFTGKLDPMKEKFTWIGYPRGSNWALDEKTSSLEPVIRETMCTKVPSKYSFEIQGEVVGGASGSPVYNPENGQLVGVLWGYRGGGTTYGQACQAKYLKKMYDEEVGSSDSK